MFLDIDKISLREAFNNDNGRTSANKIIGVITSFICMILVLALIIFYFFNTGEAATVLALIDKTIMYFGCAAGLMGVKSVSTAICRRNGGTPEYQGPIQYVQVPPEQVTSTRKKPKKNSTGKTQKSDIHVNDELVEIPDEPEECD